MKGWRQVPLHSFDILEFQFPLILMHSMQIGRRTMYVHTHSVHTYIHTYYILTYVNTYIDTCIQMLLYQNIPSSHFPAQLPSNFFAVRPRRCLAMFMNVFVPLCEHISNVRVNLHLCTRRKQRRRLSSRRTQTHTYTHLKKSTKIKRKQTLKGGKCEGKR